MMLRRRSMLGMVAAVGGSLVGPLGLLAQSANEAATPAAGMTPEHGYAPVNGLDMYYEIDGDGEPLVLIHGAFGAIDLWGPMLSGLAEKHRVVAVELQGHGHTADIDRPFGFETFADDIAALMDHLGIAQADIVGHSMGANTGLQLAIRHPDKVQRVVALSPNYRTDGEYEEVWQGLEMLTPEVFADTPIEESYARNAPNPGDFPSLVEKIKTFFGEEFAWPAEDLQSITAPVLIMVGDSDTVRPEHAVELFRLLGGGVPGDIVGLPDSRLAILPGITHQSITFDRTDLTLAMIDAFLTAPMPSAT